MTSLFSDLPLPGLSGAPRPDVESHLPRVMPPREDEQPDGGAEQGSLVADALVEGLNPPQRQAVTHSGGQLLI
ncbi:hypothetical protein, partial [Pseudactinotalea sp.]|uniref:hypothetical protein n=1 Tax=Pseudactinotalea sp. TaxID=1926260 RepID=UPI003B3BA4BB